MKFCKKHIIFLSLFLIAMMLLSACGETSDPSSENGSIPGETTVVIEQTPDGGTVEQDSEGNKITKDKNGDVVSVEDSEGNPVDVDEYLTTHGQTGTNGSSDGASSASSTTGSSNSSSSSSSGESKDQSDNTGSSENDEQVEEDIPVVIATIPDDDDMVELPDL